MTERSYHTHAKLIRLINHMQGMYAFSVKDIAKCLKISTRNAERYLALLKLINFAEYRYRGTDRYHYYRIRRTK